MLQCIAQLRRGVGLRNETEHDAVTAQGVPQVRVIH